MVSGLAPRWAAKQPHQSMVNPTGDKPPHHSKPTPTCSPSVVESHLFMNLIDLQLQPIRHGNKQRLAQAQRRTQ